MGAVAGISLRSMQRATNKLTKIQYYARSVKHSSRRFKLAGSCCYGVAEKRKEVLTNQCPGTEYHKQLVWGSSHPNT